MGGQPVEATMILTAETPATPGLLTEGQSRVQLALNVSNLDAAVEFYSRLFGVDPAKRRPGYANFAVATPPLKLVLIEDSSARGNGVAGALNHLGVEVAGRVDVSAASARLAGQGLETLDQEATTCCYAEQDKVWVHDPDGAPWEIYTVLGDAEIFSPSAGACSTDETTGSACCTPSALTETVHGVPLSTGVELPLIDAAPSAGCC
jgi:catechol 2,3-dioxygenase-like lactoylglutathione lyase family enzyme